MNSYVPFVYDPIIQTFDPSLQPVYLPQIDTQQIHSSSYNYHLPTPTAPVITAPNLVYVYQPQYPIYYYPSNMPTSYIYPQSHTI